MNKRLKVKLISVFISAVLFRISINLNAYSEVLSDNSIEQQEALGNNYKKFTGKKILLNVHGEELQGDWGDLELTPFIVEPTANFLIEQTYLNDLYDMFGSSGQWIFKDTGLEGIRSLFLKAGLDKATCDELLANTTAITDGKGFVIIPSDAELWSLTAENRAKLYPLISLSIIVLQIVMNGFITAA